MERNNKLSICFDLGLDSLKVSFSFVDNNGQVKYGKVENNSTTEFIGIPSIGLYLKTDNNKKWIFGDEAYLKDDFVYIVKIKELLSLVCSEKKLFFF